MKVEQIRNSIGFFQSIAIPSVFILNLEHTPLLIRASLFFMLADLVFFLTAFCADACGPRSFLKNVFFHSVKGMYWMTTVITCVAFVLFENFKVWTISVFIFSVIQGCIIVLFLLGVLCAYLLRNIPLNQVNVPALKADDDVYWTTVIQSAEALQSFVSDPAMKQEAVRLYEKIHSVKKEGTSQMVQLEQNILQNLADLSLLTDKKNKEKFISLCGKIHEQIEERTAEQYRKA